MAKRIRIIAAALLAAIALAVPAGAYSDTAGHWAAADVDKVTTLGLFGGLENGKFDPEGTMDRAMAVTVIWRLAGKPAYETKYSFPDAPATAWYAPALRWASRCEIVTGDEYGCFGAERSVTREELMTLILRWLLVSFPERFTGPTGNPEYYAASYTDHATDHFADAAKGSQWAASALGWAIETGMLKGDSSGRLRPGDSLTRAEAATIFSRVYDLYLADAD